MAKIFILCFKSFMKIQNITFTGNTIKQEQHNNRLYLREYNSENKLVSYKEKDIINDRFILCERFDNLGNTIEKQEFQYLPNKTIEKVSGKIAYIRTITKEIKDSLVYTTEKYISSSDPSKNYFYEIVKTLEGKIISWISNGKKII